ncbi:hypothetical protein AJ79_06067 [Helicocarpus griseus UAMH5409]|uniref:Uncharacterized protein n=1 Tax=Helicocarpus griseus UAMH5409 TaxID=1447875 RepID=A0A2B7XHG8_9EURO|nr:hypothetical protein AJ79_06067 [Helicocarpus griseus UAMH5409]
MQLPLSALLLTLACSTEAFKTSFYTTQKCKNKAVSASDKVTDGCQRRGLVNINGVINEWENEGDNKVIIATYSDENCCYSKMLQMIDWTDGCTEIKGTIKSWRVLNPDKPEKGKKDSKYDC